VTGLGLHLLCLKLLPIIPLEFLEFSPIILLCLAKLFSEDTLALEIYTSFKIVESNEVKSLVLAANCKQGTM